MIADKTEHSPPTGVVINAGKDGIEIGFEGHGAKTGAGDRDPVIYIEKYDGKIRLYVWADINSEDPTAVIDLSGARTESYEPERVT